MKIKLNEREVHTIYMSIIEHWRMPQYEQELSNDEFSSLQIIRSDFEEIHNGSGMTDEIKQYPFEFDKGEISTLIKAMKIGMRELDPTEFPTIVGEPWEYGIELVSKLEMFSQSEV
jgi:hypothetical protein